ncbi:MAG: NADH-quinone oxidoreductase subunit C [Candidatus Omnitrophica bacterium]|nr:NADH-quinone oxidoreductase subunit C [Candidatus Omnitrophota bacterium]
MPDPVFTITELITQRFPERIIAGHAYRGDETIVVRREGLLSVCRALRDDLALAFNFLMDLSCVDYQTFGVRSHSAPTLRTPSPLPYFMRPMPSAETWQRQVGQEHRFEVVYHFYSLARNHRVRVKVPVPASDPVVDSVAGLWKSADWFEREAWDMFGVRFAGHPDLRRILMYKEFEGHPLRKDYPVNRRQPLIGPVN